MTNPQKAPRGTKPRGRPASTETVEVYRFLYYAGRPVTFDEICDGISQMMRSHAYREFTKHQQAQNVPIKGDGWSDAEKDAAWRWWVDRLVKAGRDLKWIKVAAKDGRAANRIGRTAEGVDRRSLLVYSPGRPPMVDVQTITTTRVPWSPDVDKISEQVVARMNFLAESDALLRSGHKLNPEVRHALDLGRRSHGASDQ